MARMLQQYPRVLLLDPMREHATVEPPPPPHLVRMRDAFLGLQRREVIRVASLPEFLAYVEHALGWCVAIDEAHLFWAGDDARRIENAMRVMRHRRQDWFLVSHRIAWTPISVVSQLDRLLAFQMTWGTDLIKLQDEFGMEPETLKALGVGECCEWRANQTGCWRRPSL